MSERPLVSPGTRFVASVANAQIDFSDTYIDGLSGTLGQAQYFYYGQRLAEAEITFDVGEGWHTSGSRIVSDSGADRYIVALHEIGHAIGIGHYNESAAVMNAVLSRSVTDLTASDIGPAQALYGVRASATVPAAPLSSPPVEVAAIVPQASGNGSDGNDAVYRFYDTRTGDHFYTASAGERDLILRTIPHYNFEGSAFSAHTSKSMIFWPLKLNVSVGPPWVIRAMPVKGATRGSQE